MFKKVKVLMLGVMVATLVTGCGMKADYSIEISKDKDVSIKIVTAMDNELIDAMINMGDSFGSESSEEKSYTDKERWEYLEKDQKEDESFKDFKAAKYDKDGYKGYTYTLDLGKIEDLVGDAKEIEMDNIGKDSKLFTKKGDVYTLNIKTSDEDSQQMEQYAGSVNFDAKLKVKLPNKAESNNATSVDGNTYIWDLTKAKNIELSFKLTGASSKDNNMMLIVGGAVVAVGLVAVAVVVINNNKKNKVSM